MSYLNWKVGDKVVCLKNGKWSGLQPDESFPVYGGIYTIRNIEPHKDEVYIRLEEVVNPGDYEDCEECQFWAKHFRPVQTRKTDISIFTALLTPSEDDIIEIELCDYEIVAVPFQ
jgi:hypothetical protein